MGSSSAIFQYYLDKELKRRITGPDAESVRIHLSYLRRKNMKANVFQLIDRIRHSATLVATLPLDVRNKATASHAVAIRAVFIMAATSTLLAYIIRLPVRLLKERTVLSTKRC